MHIVKLYIQYKNNDFMFPENKSGKHYCV